MTHPCFHYYYLVSYYFDNDLHVVVRSADAADDDVGAVDDVIVGCDDCYNRHYSFVMKMNFYSFVDFDDVDDEGFVTVDVQYDDGVVVDDDVLVYAVAVEDQRSIVAIVDGS